MTMVRQETFELSGFGGGYEDMCQRMLWRGVGYLSEVRPPVEMWDSATEFRDIYGVMVTDGAALKAIEAAIIKPGEDCTGAMHQCVMGHLRFIHKNGIERWREELAPVRLEPGEAFTWEGSLDAGAEDGNAPPRRDGDD